MLAELLRAGLVAKSYVLPKRVRDRKALLCYHISFVQARTRVKNCVNALLDKHEIRVSFMDIFGDRRRKMVLGFGFRKL